MHFDPSRSPRYIRCQYRVVEVRREGTAYRFSLNARSGRGISEGSTKMYDFVVLMAARLLFNERSRSIALAVVQARLQTCATYSVETGCPASLIASITRCLRFLSLTFPVCNSFPRHH